MTSLTTHCTADSTINFTGHLARRATSPQRVAPATVAPRRTVASTLRRILLAARRLLPAASSPTPSDQAISTLSQRDRLGERH